MARPRRKQASVGKLLIGYLGILAVLAYMSLVPGAWKLAVFALGMAALGYLAITYGYDSRDGKDW
jgi:hypothetical protein